ncbi:sugar phosphate isomerase/epimerase family protein [Alteromonas sp. RKMC-009]|uniref:sugar phosphate isomerase/epimerase family protein n=1 Tax=Alteromonas sp. RKMC-009 TaxID=2267264 RepID=UPI000E689320|nr:TIM barrel protein [Alteromonas sp. RKMC-009]AYA63542.1 sugar phosphate isomerase/epimerase [Alteromonas sp. RKMC-009]
MTYQPKGLELGTTLYSLTTQFHGREYTFKELVRKVAAEGIGPGLEVVGFQSIKGFPVVSDQFKDEFLQLMDETNLVPSCLGINADIRINPDKPMSENESVEYHIRQLEAAAKLKFPLVRYQYPAGPSVIEKLVPTAERLNVKLGLEIHAPHHTQHPDVMAYREMYDRVNSPMLGFIPDFGSTARTVPPSFFEAQRIQGCPEDLIKLAQDIWHQDGDPYERRNIYIEQARKRGFEDRLIMSLVIIFGLFNRVAPESWAEIMHQVIHIHGKFFDFDDDGNEIAVDYERVLPVFVDGGFNGFMSSEYEGHMWNDADGFDKIKRHHTLARRILTSLKGEGNE